MTGMLEPVAFPPAGAELVVEFVVLGAPKPAGSKTSGVAYRKGPGGKPVPVMKEGRIVTFTKDSSGEAGRAWRNDVAARALQAWAGATNTVGVEMPEPLRGVPLVFEVVFVRPRATGHYGSGRNAGLLKGSAPSFPATRPDALKLARAVEDSISTIVWHDDAQVIDGRQRKVFGTPERAEVRIWRLPGTVAEYGGGAPVPAEQRSLLSAPMMG